MIEIFYAFLGLCPPGCFEPIPLFVHNECWRISKLAVYELPYHIHVWRTNEAVFVVPKWKLEHSQKYQIECFLIGIYAKIMPSGRIERFGRYNLLYATVTLEIILNFFINRQRGLLSTLHITTLNNRVPWRS